MILILCLVALSAAKYAVIDHSRRPVYFQYTRPNETMVCTDYFCGYYSCPNENECPLFKSSIGCLYDIRGNLHCSALFAAYIAIDTTQLICEDSKNTCILNYTTSELTKDEAGVRRVTTVAAIGFILFIIVNILDNCCRHFKNRHIVIPVAHSRSPVRRSNRVPRIEDTKAENDAEECIVCKENKKIYILVPCGHTSTCGKCRDVNLKQCYVCREPVNSIIRFYL